MSFGKVESRTSTPLSIGPQERISYHGNLRPFLDKLTQEYPFGDYSGHEVKQNGYEDFNLVLETSKGKFFIKCFANRRTQAECERYLAMIQTAYAKGRVLTPFLYLNQNGLPLTTISIDNTSVNLCAMQFLDGGNIWESKHPLSSSEQAMVIREAAKINTCNYRPSEVKDSWAITNAKETYEKNKDRIDPSEKKTIEDLLSEFAVANWRALPFAFVHGDIRSTNVMRHSDGKVYIIDFSVANWYPRIVDFAVICSDLLFDPENPESFQQKYVWALDQYQKAGVKLTPDELKVLPLFVKLAHAMNVIGASSVDATNYISQEENKHWLNLGRKGLTFTTTRWNPNN